MDAFGDQPWPDAQRGVFAFRHDWMEPLVERLEWQTSVTRLASGNESRQARRRVPRRWLTYKVGNARQTDALVADWLVDHLGQAALWPLPQYAVHLTEACERGALALSVTEADGRQFGPLSANVHLTNDGVQGWQEIEGNGRWILIIAADGWQIAQLGDVESDLLWLMEPLARAAAVGSTGTLSFAGGTLQYSVNNTTDYSSRISTAASLGRRQAQMPSGTPTRPASSMA